MDKLAGKVTFLTAALVCFGRAASLTRAVDGARLICSDIDTKGVESVAAEMRDGHLPIGHHARCRRRRWLARVDRVRQLCSRFTRRFWSTMPETARLALPWGRDWRTGALS